MPATIGALLTGTFFVATGSPFAAGVAFAQSGFAIGAGSALPGITVGSIVGTVALTGLALALQPGLPSPGSTKVSVRNPVASRQRHYGRVRVSGVLAELKVSEITGDGILYSATMFMTGELDAYEGFQINDQVTRIDGTGQVTYPGVWNDSSRVQLHTHLGTASQTADSRLTTAFPGRWTAAHRLDGIAYVVGKFNGVPIEDFATVYQSGVPSVSVIIRAAKVWDPRDVGQDADDPDTWTWSQNAALIILDYLRHDDGMRQPYALIEPGLDDWIDAADYCDEEVTLLSGDTEPRYQLSGSYNFDEEPKEVLKRMLAPIDGRVRLREDGALVLDVGKFTTPTDNETFSSQDIISFDLSRGAKKGQLKNEIRATYTSPGHNYQTQEADPWRDEDSIELDGLQTGTLALDMAFSHRQVRQRIKVEAKRQNPEWQGTIVTNARGLNLMGKQYARFIIDDVLDQTFYIIRSDINLLVGACTFEVVSFSEADYDFDPVEEGVSPEHEAPGNHGIAVPSGTTEVTITADGAGGGGSATVGGGGGARSVKTIAIDPADWGAVILFTNGAGGIGDPAGLGVSTSGDASTVTGTLVAGAIAMTANGGQSGALGGAGGTASGGDTNTSGSAHSGGDGGEAASTATENEAPGGGGHEGVDGGNGRVTFDWVF